jgi:hypothetical protein
MPSAATVANDEHRGNSKSAPRSIPDPSDPVPSHASRSWHGPKLSWGSTRCNAGLGNRELGVEAGDIESSREQEDAAESPLPDEAAGTGPERCRLNLNVPLVDRAAVCADSEQDRGAHPEATRPGSGLGDRLGPG